MDESLTNEMLDQTKGVAVEMYKDLVSPSAKPIGEVLSLLPRTVRLAFGGWEKWLINKEESLMLTTIAIREKVDKIPEDKLVEPEAHIAIPAIQQLCYCQDSAELRDLYANLLTSSMNADKKWQVHPAFVDIVKQLCPDEAKYLKAMAPIAIQVYPLIDVAFSIGENPRGEHTVVSNFTDYNLHVLEYPQNICSYIDNLIRLNIIEVPAGQYVVDQEAYKRIEGNTMIKNPIGVDEEKLKADIKYTYKHKLFRLTNFGVKFINVVCKE